MTRIKSTLEIHGKLGPHLDLVLCNKKHEKQKRNSTFFPEKKKAIFRGAFGHFRNSGNAKFAFFRLHQRSNLANFAKIALHFMRFLHFFLRFLRFFELEIDLSKKTLLFDVYRPQNPRKWALLEHFWRQKCLIFDFWRKSRKKRHFHEFWRSCVTGDLEKVVFFCLFSPKVPKMAFRFWKKVAFFKKKVDFDLFFLKIREFTDFQWSKHLYVFVCTFTHMHIWQYIHTYELVYQIHRMSYVEHACLYVTTCRDITHYNFYMLQHVYIVSKHNTLYNELHTHMYNICCTYTVYMFYNMS